jgi:RNA polymerase sigma-70 factor (ECF subfamily)
MKVTELYTDEALMQLIRQDDVSAFKQVYNRYWNKLFDAAYNRLRQKEHCEEFIQEIFVSLWEKRTSLILTTGLSQYLFTAVKYKVIDHYRKLNTRTEYIQVAGAISMYDNSAEETVFLNDLKAHLEKVVMQLPGKCRSVYELSRIEHKSIREIAQILNISEKTVEGHLTKALRVLRLAAAHFAVTAVIHSF